MVSDIVNRSGAIDPAAVPDERGPVRPVRRPVRARNPDARARRAEAAWHDARNDAVFHDRTRRAGQGLRRPPDARSTRPSGSRESAGGARIFLKREDLAHTGAHKINNALGQALLAKRMGKHRIIAETGAGQHGVATATACALFGLECIVYMGEVDIARQSPNVFRMKLLGAEVRPVTSGSKTLKDAINEAIRDWVTNVGTTFYIFGTAAGMHPYPMIVRDFQSVIGREAREQMLEADRAAAGCGRRLRRRRLERDRHLPPLRRRRGRSS